MGVKGEIHFVKVAGGRLLQGPVMVRSRLWDGEIEIATIPDYCAYLRVMTWVDEFDVGDTASVRARYEEERARGGYEIPELRKPSGKTFQDHEKNDWIGGHAGRNWELLGGNAISLTSVHNAQAKLRAVVKTLPEPPASACG
jgi:hypothetical protein